MTLFHALLDTWAYFMVSLTCIGSYPPGWRFVGIIGAICWIALIIRTWIEYNGT